MFTLGDAVNSLLEYLPVVRISFLEASGGHQRIASHRATNEG